MYKFCKSSYENHGNSTLNNTKDYDTILLKNESINSFTHTRIPVASGLQAGEDYQEQPRRDTVAFTDGHTLRC